MSVLWSTAARVSGAELRRAAALCRARCALTRHRTVALACGSVCAVGTAVAPAQPRFLAAFAGPSANEPVNSTASAVATLNPRVIPDLPRLETRAYRRAPGSAGFLHGVVQQVQVRGVTRA